MLQLIWTNVTSFFLDDDCGSWSNGAANPALALYLNAGATLVNSVQLYLNGGRKSVSLPVLNIITDASGEGSAAHYH